MRVQRWWDWKGGGYIHCKYSKRGQLCPVGRMARPLGRSSSEGSCWGQSPVYRGTSIIKNTPLLGPYGRNPQGHMVVLGGGGLCTQVLGAKSCVGIAPNAPERET